MNSIEANYLNQQFSLVTNLVLFAGAFAMMLRYSPQLTAVAVLLSLLPFAASILAGKPMEQAEKQVSEQNEAFVAALKDSLSGFSVVKSFKAEKEIFTLFSKSSRRVEQAKCRRRRLEILIGMAGAAAGVSAQMGVFLAGAYLVLAGKSITPGIVMVFVQLMNFVIEPIATLPSILAGRKAALGLIDKLADALEANVREAGEKRRNVLRTEFQWKTFLFPMSRASRCCAVSPCI